MARYLLLFFSILFLGLYSLHIDTFPLLGMDEPWFAFYSTDFIHTNPFPVLHSDIQYKLFCLYPLLCGFWFKIVGVSLASIRYIALISGFLGLVGMYCFIRKITPSLKILCLGLFLYSTSNITLVTSRWGRPEGLVFTALIWCLYALYLGMTEHKKWGYIGAGFLCSVMVLLHPFSLASVLPITVAVCLLNFSKQKKNIFYFFIGTTPFLGAFLINMLIINFDYTKTLFLDQLSGRLAFNSESPSLYERLSYFVLTYALGWKRLWVLLFELGILIWSAYTFRKNTPLRALSFIGIGTFLMGILIISPFRRRYFGIVMMVSILLTCATLASARSRTYKRWLLFFIGIYLLNNCVADAFYIHKHYTNTPYHEVSTAIRKVIPSGSRVATRIEFWLPLHDSFTITNIHTFPIENYQTITEVLNKHAVKYVVYSDYLENNLSPTTGEASYGFDFTKDDYNEALKTIVLPHWTLVATIPSNGYGDIQIYKVPSL